MLRIDVACRCFESVLTRLYHRVFMRILRQLREPRQHIAQVRVGEQVLTQFEQVAQVIHSGRDTVDEMLLMLEVTAETVGS